MKRPGKRDAGGPPAEGGRSGILGRGKMRRRLRRQQQVREALLLDLGALVFELHRQGRREPELLQTKAAELSAVDREVRSLAEALGSDRSAPQLVSPGIHGSCPNCGALLTVDDRFCSSCGTSTDSGLAAPETRGALGREEGAGIAAAPDGEVTISDLPGHAAVEPEAEAVEEPEAEETAVDDPADVPEMEEAPADEPLAEEPVAEEPVADAEEPLVEEEPPFEEDYEEPVYEEPLEPAHDEEPVAATTAQWGAPPSGQTDEVAPAADNENAPDEEDGPRGGRLRSALQTFGLVRPPQE